jgi:hypothetical protein
MMQRRKTVKRIGFGAAVLALAGASFTLGATPAFANAPPAGWSLFGNYPTESACAAAASADGPKYGWTDWGCYQWPPGRGPWGLYYTG